MRRRMRKRPREPMGVLRTGDGRGRGAGTAQKELRPGMVHGPGGGARAQRKGRRLPPGDASAVDPIRQVKGKQAEPSKDAHPKKRDGAPFGEPRMTTFSKNFPPSSKKLWGWSQQLLRQHKTTQDNPRPLWTICILFVLQKHQFKSLLQLKGLPLVYGLRHGQGLLRWSDKCR